MRKERGITLVALVITVIVLIILAGVTLSTLVGANGIITKAQEAKQNMANAAAEEDKLIQNLLNEIKGIEAGEEEIEVPDIPKGPTIEEVLKEGDYVWYEDAFGTKQKCIVLYGPGNSNYGSYGIQVITEDTVGNLTLGSSDFNETRDSYNNAIATLNEEAEKYRKKSDGIAELARCVGSVPDNPNYDGAEMYTRSENWFINYNNTFKDIDNNYEMDCSQMEKLNIVNLNKYYWLASRIIDERAAVSYFCVNYINQTGGIFEENYIPTTRAPEPGVTDCSLFLCWGPVGSGSSSSYDFGLRIVIQLKDNTQIISGDGSKENPYNLAP